MIGNDYQITEAKSQYFVIYHIVSYSLILTQFEQLEQMKPQCHSLSYLM